MDLTWIVIGLLGLMVVLLAVYLALAQRERVSNTLQLFTFLPAAPLPAAPDRILIVAPHPDDEGLMAAGYGRQALAQGAHVSVIMMTMGDGFYLGAAGHYRRPRVGSRRYLSFGRLRRKETERSVAHWGGHAVDLHFLGLPDQGIARIWERSWSPEHPYRSPFTQATQAPYPDVIQEGLPYSGEAISQALEDLLGEIRPTLVILPHPLDAHGDHWATAAFMDHALTRMWSHRGPAPSWPEPRRLYAVTHRGTRWPQPMGLHPYLPLRPPATLAELSKWMTFPLEPDSVRVKQEALEAHASQLPLLSQFLYSFVRRNELFTTLPPVRLGREPVILSHMEAFEEDGMQSPGAALDVPKRDTMAKDIQTMADIDALHLDLTEDGCLGLTVRTRRPTSRRVVFQLETHLLGSAHGDGRLTVTYVPSRRIRVRLAPGTPHVDPAALRLRRSNGHWQLLLPLAALSGTRHIMFSVKTRTRFGQLVDRTGWQTLVLP